MKQVEKWFGCAVVCFLLCWAFGCGTGAESEKDGPSFIEEEIRWDGPPMIRWDDKDYYWEGTRVYEDLLCPDAVGTISSVVDGAEPVTENGQTNIPKISEGAEIRRTAYGDAIAVFIDGRWSYFQPAGPLGPEEVFYIPQNEWRPFLPDEGTKECADVTLTVEQDVVDAEALEAAPHIALIIKNASDHEISYCRGGVYVLKQIDGEWCFWLGAMEPGDTWEDSYVLLPSQEERFLAPLSVAFPKSERDAGTYRVGMYVDYDSEANRAAVGRQERGFVYTEFVIR